MADFDRDTNTFSLSVREICDFIYRDGDVASDGYSLPEEKMLAGAKFHRSYEAKMEKSGFISEYRMQYTHEYGDGLRLCVTGIADLVKFIYGKDGVKTAIEIGEIKTVSKDVKELDWESIKKYDAQALFYVFLLYKETPEATDAKVSLIYHNIDAAETNIVEKHISHGESCSFYEETASELLKWLHLYIDHKKVRDESIKSLQFPYGEYRKNQRELCAAVYRSVRDMQKLFAEAPTGTGKTISALFPAIKAMGEGCGSKIFYLTAKVITRKVAVEAVRDMAAKGLLVRTAVLSAKSKSCLGGGNCLPHLCKYSKGHGERVNEALFALICENDLILPETVASYAEKYTVCPHELALDASLFCDIVVGDYNHAYDPTAMLQRYFSIGGDYTLLVDEAHNLPDRARDMYSCMLDAKQLRAAAKILKEAPKKLASRFSKLARELSAIGKPEKSDTEAEADAKNAFPEKDEEKRVVKLSETFINALQSLCEAYSRFLQKDENDELKEKTLELYFDCKFFLKLTELCDVYDNSFASYFDSVGRGKRLNLVCTDPSGILEDAATLTRSTVFFSATLRPFEYYFSVLGGSLDRDRYVRISSPFPDENLFCAAIKGISTRYKDRDKSYDEVARVIRAATCAVTGNYMIFFPSFRYLDCVFEHFTEMCEGDGKTELICQTSEMSDAERADFLSRFDSYGEKTLIGFSVCGGVFSEGVDLKGGKLSGAVIVGTGMPAVCFERDLLKKAYSAKGRDGFDFAYTYPGLNRVFQAGGRVIRTETDRGFIILIDDRYARSKYLDHFPDSWRKIRILPSANGLEQKLSAFLKLP